MSFSLSIVASPLIVSVSDIRCGMCQKHFMTHDPSYGDTLPRYSVSLLREWHTHIPDPTAQVPLAHRTGTICS